MQIHSIAHFYLNLRSLAIDWRGLPTVITNYTQDFSLIPICDTILRERPTTGVKTSVSSPVGSVRRPENVVSVHFGA